MTEQKTRRSQGRTGYFTRREAALIDAAADWSEVRVSEWLRNVALAAAEELQRRRERRERRERHR